MSSQTLFYALGIALVLAALGVSAIGVRSKDFPSRPVFVAGAVLFLGLVVTTGTFALLNARDEQDKRREKLAAEKAPPPSPKGGKQGKAPAGGGGGGTISISVVAGTNLAFTQKALTAPAGNDTIAFDNPQVVGHDVVIAQGTTDLAKVNVITKSKASTKAVLKPGDYVFYCSVPGHRQAGMEGKLTVK